MELIAVVLGAVCAVLLLAVLGVLAATARRSASAPAASGDAGRLAQDLADARAALEQERAGHAATRERLWKTEGDLREAAVHAGRVATLEERLGEAERRAHDAEKSLESALAGAKERDRAHQEKVQELVAFRAEMEKQFKALSNEALAAQSETFTKSSKERLETMLAPLKEQIGNFQSAFVQDGQTRAEQSSSLKTMIESLTKETGRTQETAESLARALKGSSQAQGAWGEMILQTILEKSGLREGEEYITQQSHTLADGARLRPDVVVNLPGSQKLVIDSKVSLVAFNDCVNCEDDTQRAAHVKAHLGSLRTHIKGLSAKDYSTLHDGVDFVVLFVPIESALSLAVQHDADITATAAASNVMLASPNTLMMALRTVQNLWRIERQNQNAHEIAQRAGKLYEKFAGFVDDLEKIGDSLNRTRAQYDAAYGKLTGGPGNLVRQAELLKQMGARTSKQISDKTLAVSDERDDAPDSAAPEARPRGGGKTRAGSPDSLPRFSDAKADSYAELTDKEKQVAAAISQDWDA